MVGFGFIRGRANDAFAGTANDGAASELPTYRQTGTIFVMAIEYFNYPRSLSEMSDIYFIKNLRASVSVKHAEQLGGKVQNKCLRHGVLTHIIYDYGIKLKFIPKRSVAALNFFQDSYRASQQSLVVFAGLTLDFLTKPMGTI